MFDKYEEFKADVLKLTKIDLNYYKEKQMRRRIDTLANKNGAKSYEEYIQMIKSDKSLEYQIRGVDVDSNGHIDLYLIRATQRGYTKPRSNSGCRLRTGNPDNGR